MRYIIKALIDGVFSIVKLAILLYAIYLAFDSGLVERVINMFK